MIKQYKEADNEICVRNAFTAAALMSKSFDHSQLRKILGDYLKAEQIEEVMASLEAKRGWKYLRVQDTISDRTKEVVFERNEETERLLILFMNRQVYVEPHDFENNWGEIKDRIEERIKQTSSHKTHVIEEHDE
ncbi:MAG: hypothetical protein HWN68_14005 [Desulfobacterales bacterium]|nr:hypothetical protein [Desulfobacterales bacterium]